MFKREIYWKDRQLYENLWKQMSDGKSLESIPQISIFLNRSLIYLWEEKKNCRSTFKKSSRKLSVEIWQRSKLRDQRVDEEWGFTSEVKNSRTRRGVYVIGVSFDANVQFVSFWKMNDSVAIKTRVRRSQKPRSVQQVRKCAFNA